MTEWEYWIETLDLHEAGVIVQLNQSGNEGWELVSVVPGAGTGGTLHTVIFKRPKSN